MVRNLSDGELHEFGGNWTAKKLAVIKEYLESYTTVLKNQPFTTIYIDAFAGSGYRATRKKSKQEPVNKQLPFGQDLAGADSQSFLDGSAKIALQVDPPFDEYVFIEKSAKRCSQLEGLATEFRQAGRTIRIINGEANVETQRLCQGQWHGRRAVLFLDPYGMQVEWATLEAIAGTKAIDLWLLFPLGIGLNRVLPKSGEVPSDWRERINTFGTL